MTYKLDGVNLETFGAHPYVNQGYIALTGVFDTPKRIGTTEHNWGTSVEAFTDVEDIELDGRTLTLEVCIKGISADDYRTKLDAYKSACVSCRKLWTEFGEFDVVMKDSISVEEHADNFMAIVTSKFWQQKVILPKLTILPSGDTGNLLDGYNLEKDFGVYISSGKDCKSVAKRIEVSTTTPYTQTQYREARNISFECTMVGSNLQELYSKISQFQALCMGSGLRKMKFPENEIYDLYFKDGMAVKAQSETLLTFDLKCRVVA